jgi:hypothetical protein
MKKLLVVLLALTALSAMAFADDVVWTYGVTVKTGAQITAANAGSTLIQPYDADDSVASRIRFDAEAGLGDFSAHIRIGGDLGGNTSVATVVTAAQLILPPPLTLTGVGLFQPAWWVNAYFLEKMIQLQFGDLDHSVTDTVNKGWGGLSVNGAQAVVAPISGLSVGLSIPVPNDTLDAALAGMRVGLAYTMPNLATVKGTYINVGGTNLSELAFGVAVLAVPNLTAQVEADIKNLGSSTAQTIELFENAAYVMGPLTPAINLDEILYSASGLNTQIAINPSVDYVVMTGTAVGLSVTYTMNVKGASTSKVVADPYVAFTFNPKAALKIDAAYTISDLSNSGTWTLPININFKFSY